MGIGHSGTMCFESMGLCVEPMELCTMELRLAPKELRSQAKFDVGDMSSIAVLKGEAGKK